MKRRKSPKPQQKRFIGKIAQQQNNANTLNAAVALHQQGQLDQAGDLYHTILQSEPEHFVALHLLGLIAVQRKDLMNAIKFFDQALTIKPDYVEALNNRGNTLMDLNRPEQALENYNKAITIKFDYANALYGRGNALRLMKRHEQAVESYARALAIKPDFAEAHWYESVCRLSMGDFMLGWQKYEWRWKRESIKNSLRSFKQLVWRGNQDIKNKTMLLYSEQGLGDTIQFCRYATQVAELGAKVILEVQPALKTLLTGLKGVTTLLGKGEDLPDFDYHCPLMSLPLAFKTTIESIPCGVPYLFAENARLIRWQNRLDKKGLKIGINWQGSTGPVDAGRSFPLSYFNSISRISNVNLISLQQNAGTEQLNSMPEGMIVEILGDDFNAGEDAFLDTAAVIKHLDLVITSDTAIAHLAGSLGCPVWVALSYLPDWRWMLEGNTSPWYPTIRLFRQKQRDDWEGVFNDIHAELLNLSKGNCL